MCQLWKECKHRRKECKYRKKPEKAHFLSLFRLTGQGWTLQFCFPVISDSLQSDHKDLIYNVCPCWNGNSLSSSFHHPLCWSCCCNGMSFHKHCNVLLPHDRFLLNFSSFLPPWHLSVFLADFIDPVIHQQYQAMISA